MDKPTNTPAATPAAKPGDSPAMPVASPTSKPVDSPAVPMATPAASPMATPAGSPADKPAATPTAKSADGSMDKLTAKQAIREVLLVEGKYDKNTLSQVVDALILTTDGFGIFKDAQKVALLRRLAAQRGLVVLTDADGAGLVIRNYLKGILPAGQVKMAYIPDVPGKERRKRAPGKEGKLGVEGMDRATLLRALDAAGATWENGEGVKARPFTKAVLYQLGLTGVSQAANRRKKLQKALGLPENLSANALMDVLNLTVTLDEVAKILRCAPEDPVL